ncbi:class I SAM-dependent methyltransferase [Candidatus Peregrinibacteria bacterium]|jgi:SAM-dependent methyltransferase|nr:class I SAM-dependent methyltransferase [Candidatus Peregrinibacteria bacterium]MBT3599125.1 class I SAM-dependent methyltransferase [Candidatus Peregrinibacteria bacterium]MBT4585975.1 class I SAM-dependent methyltransferase [Candidatus Peregrinibacteria bacterium]MBT6730765.1 class I SAM-dependent methyltransferase [Candidatus Peregrinibacteria bacterium]MBT7008903.1 class I SAM-dependent methyltransferase [Candidatus Peregrinibacteria bacterium]
MKPQNDFRLYTENLTRAREAIFQGQKGLPIQEYRTMLQNAYSGRPISFEKDCEIFNFQESAALTDVFHLAEQHYQLCQNISDTRLDTIEKASLIIGCGQGRLLDVQVALCKMLGIKEIHLNELSAENMSIAKRKADDIDTSDCNLQFHTGDFQTQEFDKIFSVILSFRSVTSEIFDPTSSDHYLESRYNLYKRISQLLSPDGVFIEDVPDCDAPGFYHILNTRTREMLKQKGILSAINDRLLLTVSCHLGNQKMKFPYQLRVANPIGIDLLEKKKVGLSPMYSTTRIVPEKSQLSLSDAAHILNNSDSIQQARKVFAQRLASGQVEFCGDFSDKNQYRRMTCYSKDSQ